MTIKVLGTGCPKCIYLEEAVRRIIDELSLGDIKIEHVYDIDKIVSYGVMTTPALVIDEEVKVSGRIPTDEEIKSWLS